MAVDVSDSFIKQFESEVHMNYQRYGSKVRMTVRQQNDVEGESTTFQVVGKGTATQKGRHTNIPPMNISHTPVECVLQDWFAADYADALDLEKLNIDERGVIARSGAAALGRKTDELITNVMDAVTTLSTSAWTLQIAQDMIEALSDNDVFMAEGEVYGAVGMRQWNIMMNDSSFSNAEFVRDHPLVDPNFHRMAKLWSGVIWYPCSGNLLPLAGSNRSVFVYHRDSVGCATGHELSSEIDWISEKDSWFIKNKMAQNAVVIDATGITKVLATE